MLNLRKLMRSWLGVDKLDFRVGGLTERIKMMNEGVPTKPNSQLTYPSDVIEHREVVKGYDKSN